MAVLFALSILSFFAGGNLNAGVREDRGNRWVIAVFGVIGFLNAYLPAYTDRKDLWTIDGDTIRWLGVALFAAGGALRIWPVFVLGHRFSGLVAIQPGHTLVTRGIYGVIRHPSYLGLLINSLGWSLAFRSGVGVLLTALLIPPLLARINAEENLLHSQFGDEYDAYRSQYMAPDSGDLLADSHGQAVALLSVLNRGSATESGLLEMREVALVECFTSSRDFLSRKMH